MNLAKIPELLLHFTEEERQELEALLAADQAIWRPLPGPQQQAYASTATIIGYGGAAGGGKTDLACGKALTQHRRIAIFRRTGPELTAITDRLTELIGHREGYNGREMIWRLPGRQIEFGAVPISGDERKYQGRPHDLLVFDEAAHFLERQIRFLLGWLRTTNTKQRCQALLTFNPPTCAEGRWIIDFFAPWLDPGHPAPAQPGELRWFAMLAGKEQEVPNGTPFMHDGEIVTPTSRTFIPSRVSDNPFLMGTAYMATLQALPEPLRSQMLHGDFQAGIEDDPWQVIPTAWIDFAMARWQLPDKKLPMDSLGVDVARGGQDQTVIARRHGPWFDVLLAYPGSQTPDGPAVAGLVVAAARDHASIHIDVIGVGSAPYDFLRQNQQPVLGINVSEKSHATDRSGRLRFTNLRSQLWWHMREALDPANNTGLALPCDAQLRADLCAPTWTLQGPYIRVEGREAVVARLGRSPDRASAVILGLIDTPKRNSEPGAESARRRQYDPYGALTIPQNMEY